jgi:diaminobutyrate-2-oxoglutarate transaminase
MTVFEEFESEVRSYCRHWPAVFTTALGSSITSQSGVVYLDFFSGAGALSYGHNHPLLVQVAVDHLNAGYLIHSLDAHTPQKQSLLEALRDHILKPRNLDMIVQFVGPTGATAVEAALRLSEKLTERLPVVAYEGGYHGMSAAAASVTESTPARFQCPHTFLPYVSRCQTADLERLEAALRTPIEGQRPGALIIEPVQADGGARPFDPAYLAMVRTICTEHDVVVIADEVQVGNGRTGPFFSFEGSGLDPDIICVSKSLSGLGLPMAINLVRRELDVWTPGEFTGTFRGNNLAFATAKAALNHYWSDDILEKRTSENARTVRHHLEQLRREAHTPFSIDGKGMIWGLHFENGETARSVAAAAFTLGLIVETCGRDGRVLKLLPPLVIKEDELIDGLERLAVAVRSHVPID